MNVVIVAVMLVISVSLIQASLINDISSKPGTLLGEDALTALNKRSSGEEHMTVNPSTPKLDGDSDPGTPESADQILTPQDSEAGTPRSFPSWSFFDSSGPSSPSSTEINPPEPTSPSFTAIDTLEPSSPSLTELDTPEPSSPLSIEGTGSPPRYASYKKQDSEAGTPRSFSSWSFFDSSGPSSPSSIEGTGSPPRYASYRKPGFLASYLHGLRSFLLKKLGFLHVD